jgi:hypothetical protein
MVKELPSRDGGGTLDKEATSYDDLLTNPQTVYKYKWYRNGLRPGSPRPYLNQHLCGH